MLETVIVSDILNSFFNVLYFFNALFVISKTWLKWWRDVTTQQGLKYSFEMKYSFVCVNSSTYSCIVIVSLGGKASANVSRMEMTWDFTIMIFYRNRIWKMKDFSAFAYLQVESFSAFIQKYSWKILRNLKENLLSLLGLYLD